MIKLNKEKREMIFETRMSFIQKYFDWEQKIYYAVLFFIGSVLLSLMYNIDKMSIKVFGILFGVIFFIGIIIMAFVELISWRKFYSLYNKLIDDIVNNDLEKKEEFSLKNHILNK